MTGYTCVFQTDEEYEEYKTNKNNNTANIKFITEPDIKRTKLSDDESFYFTSYTHQKKIVHH